MKGGNGDGSRRAGVYAASGGEYGGQGYAGPPQGPPAFAPEPEPEGPNLRDYIAVLWRRKWIILLVILVATAFAYYFSARQAKVYEASADLIYEAQLDVANPLTGQSYTDPYERNLQLQSVGSVIASPEMVRRAGDLLRTAGAPARGFKVTSAPVVDTSAGTTSTASNVVRITASSGVPQLAAAAANAYAEAFVKWRKETVRTQVDRAISVMKRKLAVYAGATKQSTDYLVLQQRLQDLEILQATATGNFRRLVPATVPTDPVAPQPLGSAILWLGIGLFAGIGLAFLLEQFDTRVRRPDQIAQILQQPVLGRVPRISKKLLGESAMVTLRHPDGQVAEAFRMVRTNLDFMAVDADVKSIAVTSCVKGEGKSVTVANLAVTMALAGKKVVVVDGDLRRPRMHTYFDVPNEVGVSTVASGRDKLTPALVPVAVGPPAQGANGENDDDFDAWAQGSEARSHLYLLPSGPIPPNPGEIVASRRFEAMLETLTQEADMVIVDTPALLAVGDTSAIAARVDGLVFLVDMQVARTPQLRTAADQLRRLPVKMLGTVLRMHAARGGRYYYSPYYYHGYGYAEDGRKVKEKQRRSPRREMPKAQEIEEEA